jgi:quercetin dioxygenase-like cupin family protein
MYRENELLTGKTTSENDIMSFNADSFTFDLTRLVENMKHEKIWTDGELNTMILLKSPAKKIMLTILHEGTEIISNPSDQSVTLQVLEGKLDLRIQNESIELGKGELVTIHKNLRYSFDSLEDTAYLLTIS